MCPVVLKCLSFAEGLHRCDLFRQPADRVSSRARPA